MIAGQERITGVAQNHDISGTLALALRLHPGTRDVVVIHDYTDTGIAMRHEVETAALRISPVKLRFIAEMPLENIVETIKLLSPDTLVLLLSYTVDGAGRTCTLAEAARRISSDSPVPVYAVHAEQLGNGVVGGRMMSGEAQGHEAAELAVRILAGEDATGLPVLTDGISRTMFDYRVMRTFGIDSDKLPANALVINKPPPTYAVGKTAFWLAVLFTLFTSLGVIVLFRNIRQRKSLETSLRIQINEYQHIHGQLRDKEDELLVQLQVIAANEKKFRTLFESMNEGFALHDLILGPDDSVTDYRIVMVNRAYTLLTGIPAATAQGAMAGELYGAVQPPYLEEFSRVALTGEPCTFEAFFRPMDRYFHISVVCPAKGQFATVFEDVTEYKKISRFQRAILDNAAYAIITTTVDGIITSFNPAAEQLFGYTADEVVTLRTPEIFHLADELAVRAGELSRRYNETIRGFEALVASVIRGDAVPSDWTCVRKDGNHVAIRLDMTVNAR